MRVTAMSVTEFARMARSYRLLIDFAGYCEPGRPPCGRQGRTGYSRIPSSPRKNA